MLPAVVVGHHRHGGIGNPGFVGQGAFRGEGHIDDIGAPGPEHFGFRSGGEPGSFDGDDRPGLMMPVAELPAGTDEFPAQTAVEGFGHRGMFHFAGLELVKEGQGPTAGEIDELVGYHQVAPAHILPERSDGGSGQDRPASQILQGPDMGPVVHEGGRDGMVATVAGHQCDIRSADASHPQGRT